jgi:hypothetical protein
MDEHRGASGCFDCLEIINNVPVDFGKPGVVSGKVGDTNQAWNADDRAVRVRHVKLLEQFFIRYITLIAS